MTKSTTNLLDGFRRFLGLPPKDKVLVFRASILLLRYSLFLPRRRFSDLTSHLEHFECLPEAQELSQEQLARARSMGAWVARLAIVRGLNASCLIQVMVLQRLLEREQIPGFICIGVRHCEEFSGSDMFSAHAWLQCGEEVVNGGPDCSIFKVMSAYRWPVANG